MIPYLCDSDFEHYVQVESSAFDWYFPQWTTCPHCYYSEMGWFRNGLKGPVPVRCGWCSQTADQTPIEPVPDDDLGA